MASKDSLFKGNPHHIPVKSNLNDQFNNLNLNQNNQISNANLTTINSGTGYDKNFPNKAPLTSLSDPIESQVKQRKSVLFNRVENKLSLNSLNNDSGSEKKEFKKQNSSNKSTLSLHIAAYENSVDGALNDSKNTGNPVLKKKKKTSNLSKKWKNVKQFFVNLISNNRNTFEYTREEEDDDDDEEEDDDDETLPEVMQFKASQKLLNPYPSNVAFVSPQPLPSPVKRLPLETLIFGDDVVISKYNIKTKEGNIHYPPLNFLPFDGVYGDPEEKAEIILKAKVEREEMIKQLKELKESMIQQVQLINQQHDSIEAMRAPYLPVIEELEKLHHQEEKEPLFEYHKLIHHRESLLGGIEQFKRDYARIKFRNKQEIEELQEEIAKAKERAAKKREVKSTQSTNAIVQKQTNFDKSSIIAPPVYNKEADEEKAMLKSKIFQRASILVKLKNLKRIKSAMELRLAVQYGTVEDMIVVIDKLEYNFHRWLADGILMKFDNEGFQLVIKNEFRAKSIDLSPIIPRILWCHISKLYLENMNITVGEFEKLIEAGNLTFLRFQLVQVKDEDDNVVDIAEIIKDLRKLEVLGYCLSDGESTPCQKLAALPPFPKLSKFHLHGIEEDFDLRVFAEFITKNQLAAFFLKFFSSDEYFARVKDLAAEILPQIPPGGVVFDKFIYEH